MEVRTVYKNGLPAIATSVVCSLCTTIISQGVLFISDDCRSIWIQMLHSVVIFVVAYWLVYFALREYIASLFTEIPLFRECRGALDSRRQLSSKAALFGRIFFVTASEIFWILSLSIGNYLLLSYEFSAARAAFISQWGVNLIIWLPLLPIWEEFAVYRVPTLWAERGNHLV